MNVLIMIMNIMLMSVVIGICLISGEVIMMKNSRNSVVVMLEIWVWVLDFMLIIDWLIMV